MRFEVPLSQSLDYSVALLPVAPFLAALLAPFVHRIFGALSGWVLAVVPAAIFVVLLGYVAPLAEHPGEAITSGLPWIPDHGIALSFLIDGLSLTFALLISGIGTIIVVYSGAYLKGHRHQGRFLSFILMFMGSMLGVVLADDMMVLFVFWELTTITSFLLIGFDHTREASRRAAIQALVVTGGGGLVLLAGFATLHLWSAGLAGDSGTWLLSEIRQHDEVLRAGAVYTPVLLMVLVGAFTKSAQFPFSFWLPNAMEAPTPVSAFLHSATMVKAGVYLLMRMNPMLGGEDALLWQVLLTVFGGITLIWGATLALRQTDLKQMLAQTTVASLGLLVLLTGQGTEAAIAGACLYLVAHAAYKGGLFLVAGLIDHGTGTREITDLGGLRKAMPLTFVAAVLGGLSMAGLPLTLGFLAKEEMYLAFAQMGDVWGYVVMTVVFAGNAMMMAVGIAIAVMPFFGGTTDTPKNAHEGPLAMYAGPILLGFLALVGGTLTGWTGENILAPAASAIASHEVHPHLKPIPDFLQLPIYVSVATWALGYVLFRRLKDIRLALKALLEATGWSFDRIFDALMSGLVLGAHGLTRFLHHGRLELYLIVVFIAFAAAIGAPILAAGAWPEIVAWPDLTSYEYATIAIALIGLLAVLVARTRLVAIVSLGIQGFAVALIFMLFGAPDLSFTQFMVEILSVVILTLVMTRLYLDRHDRRVLPEVFRDGGLALICGVAVSALLLVVLQTPLDMRLSELFAATSVPIAHGHNVVNVILVDYRGLDTLGEISVVMTAGIAIFALIRMRGGGPKLGIGAKKHEAADTAERAGA
ncbi:MAG: putative monovalent cation/H+ antiporter subunit A [Alphaproteobacteria bacterium]|nr:putative monovalent cation/H+ antiporter subunit A [Alphaproteobacteria bacterium]